ncbi:hypothetical protein [Streptomyces sp. NPDC054863]
MAYAPERVAEFLQELGNGHYEFDDTDDLWFLVKSVQATGFLSDVSIFPLASTDSRDDPFLVGVEVVSEVVVTSAPIQWCSVAPPLGCRGEGAVLHVLAQLESVVEDLRASFARAVAQMDK